MTNEQLTEFVKTLKQVSTSPPTLTAKLKAESDSIEEKTPCKRSAKADLRQKLLDEL